MRVSVIIPTLNRREMLRDCLAALPAGMSGVDYELIVVDSGDDKAADEAEAVGGRAIRQPAPICFAAAINLGAKQSQGEWLLLLNDDAVPAAGFCAAMLGTAASLGALVVGSRTLLPDGKIQQAGVGFLSDGRPVMLDYQCSAGQEPRREDRYAAAVCFACALVRTDVFLSLGGIDEEFVNSYDDVDFCLRATERGYRIAYHAAGQTIHRWAPSAADRLATASAALVRLLARWQYRLPSLIERAADVFIVAEPSGGYSVVEAAVRREWTSDSIRTMEADVSGDLRTKRTLDAVRTPADAFHMLYTHSGYTAWLGVQIVKNHFDMARYVGLIARLQPGCIVETGGQCGGSALFFMNTLDTFGLRKSLVVSVDSRGGWDERVYEYGHPIALLKQDCLAEVAVASVKTLVRESQEFSGRLPIIVSLDSVHTEEHVRKELELYSPLCRSGDYLVVEDTDHSGHPIMSDYGPSAWHAVQSFLASNAPFVADDEIERAYGPITASPSAWLRRI